ncbi:DUF2000 domain-containing protein [Lichenibacterium ramalinae]|uniref:DUF2000 domain-containing protein n=1 Tax=Lichenibacterium ramalinae TaxID=2316527 RepID=A0A4Q2RE26_9HYPH|nr:DUF2000 domain-containing protein [Lichenibacterium ramalinae]RYB05216.1 DUF2000 domain-containing protein [Lichenibacterium ramalinae]
MGTKAVVILAEHLPVGLKANIAAVMGMSLGTHRPDLVGPSVATSDGMVAPGITTIPIPVLTAPGKYLSAIWAEGIDAGLDLMVPFTDAALRTKTYEEYTAKLTVVLASDMPVHGILLLGDKKSVNSLVGQLPLLS